MFPFSRFKRLAFIGLDVQQDRLCLLQVTDKKRMPLIEKHGAIELPPGVIIDGKVMISEKLTSVVQQLVEQTGTQNMMTAIALPSHCVISKSIQLPAALSSAELEAEIYLRLSQYLPGISDEVSFDYHKLRADKNFQDILLIAAKSQLMSAYVDAVNQAGLFVKVVEVDIHAIARAFLHCVKISNKTVALLDAASIAANFLVIHEQQIIFSQQIILAATTESRVMQLLSLIQSYDAVHRLQKISHIYLSGKLFSEEVTRQVFETTITTPVTILSANFPMEYSLTSLGLSLRGGVYARN